MADLPHEVLQAICAVVSDASYHTDALSLDPIVDLDRVAPQALPSSYPAGNWSGPITRRTLNSLGLVSRSWYNAAKPFIWRHVEVRLPRTWLAFVDEVASAEEETEEETNKFIDSSVQHAAAVALITNTAYNAQSHDHLHLSILARLGGVPHDSIPPELLSPPASRDPSPARLRAKSPGRWRFMRAVSETVQSLEPGVYVPTPLDPRPGRHVKHLDFTHFRTIGMRRSVEEGVRSRFVTAERIERVLKEMPHLAEFGATEYMDGALNKTVITELFLRGNALSYKHIPSVRGRGVSLIEQQVQNETSDNFDRLRECNGLDAVDLCGCVSSVFVQGLVDFVKEYLEEGVDEDGMGTAPQATIPSLKRLGMRGVTSVPSSVLATFVMACTSLTHLDLSGTKCSPDLLMALAGSTSVQLTCLALARCTRLTGESIADFLIDGLSARTITQLSLYGDGTFPSPLSELDLHRIITQAPAFLSGSLQYLDLSSSPVTDHLLRSFAAQPALRSLGLSHIANLPLGAVVSFIRDLAPNTEVLALVSTSPELAVTLPWRQLSLSVHSRLITPLTQPPYKFSLLPSVPVAPPPTRLRVIELGVSTLNSLGAGREAWRVVRSKGGRGWYVHSASGWVNGELRRDLDATHPMRVELERLAASNGNVGSGVGWHARKMEVLRGQGLLGREDGLYGAVSFAYQG
ncbi:hypothetical protein FRB93_013832 [Tulasnella sp. JGI-2019a]|nr:hypothetical protein FRB93_013832 [Tulasnella sp. JGI-2019a]